MQAFTFETLYSAKLVSRAITLAGVVAKEISRDCEAREFVQDLVYLGADAYLNNNYLGLAIRLTKNSLFYLPLVVLYFSLFVAGQFMFSPFYSGYALGLLAKLLLKGEVFL